MTKDLTGKFPLGITARELDLSPEESKRRTKKILEQQKAIRRDTKYYMEDLQKIYFPQFGPNYGK